MSNLLQDIASPMRQLILTAIWEEEATVSELAEQAGVTISAVSQHLHALREVDAVTVRQEWRTRYYRANRTTLSPLAGWFERHWRDRLMELKRHAEEEEASLSAPNQPGDQA